MIPLPTKIGSAGQVWTYFIYGICEDVYTCPLISRIDIIDLIGLYCEVFKCVVICELI